MTIIGFDVDQNVGPLAEKIVAAGYQFVGRYLKNLAIFEAQELSDVGIPIVSIWEGHGNKATFTSEQGKADGIAARGAAMAIGQPRGTVIISAIDYNAPEGDWPGIEDYFSEFSLALSTSYKAGGYGNGLMLGKLLDQNLISVAYLAGAEGWWGSVGFTRWHIRQHPTITDLALGIEIDGCEAVSLAAVMGWTLPPAAPAAAVPSALALQKALNATGAGLVEDGVWGPRSAAALAAYYRAHG